MAGVFISHRSSSEDLVKNFVGHFLVRSCGVQPWHVFTTFRGTEVPAGSMMYGRVLRALLDAPVVIVWADPLYFQSSNCIIELGASIGARGTVFYLLSPEMPIKDVPEEFSWISWNYAHDEETLLRLEQVIAGDQNIDGAPHLQIDGYQGWPGTLTAETWENLRDHLDVWPKLVESRPLSFDQGRSGAVFALLVWRLENGATIPIVFADDDQTSVMNADRLVEQLKSEYSVEEIYALWPDADMGVCAHTGGGGTRRQVDQELLDMGIPLPQETLYGEQRLAANYWAPTWYEKWSTAHP